MPDARERSRAFLAGANLTFDEANALWRQLLKDDEPSLARSVLSAMRAGDQLSDGLPAKRSLREKLCQQEAMLTSKDPELSSAVRHDRALEVLTDEFDLDDPRFDDVETLGIAGGILKRRWVELGQHRDLQRSAELYLRGAGDDLGEDAYAHINAAFLEDLLASTGDDPGPRRARAKALRERIAEELPVLADNWWNAASRAEALFGLRRYGEAKTALEGA